MRILAKTVMSRKLEANPGAVLSEIYVFNFTTVTNHCISSLSCVLVEANQRKVVKILSISRGTLLTLFVQSAFLTGLKSDFLQALVSLGFW